MRLLLVIFLCCFATSYFSQQVSGTITDEEGNPIPAVLVFNIKTEKYTYTTINGNFSIECSENDELRFARKSFERVSKTVNQIDFSSPLRIILERIPGEIEEVNVPNIRLTGDLNKDAKNLSKIDKVDELQKEIGVPKPPEKPREVPSEVTKDVLLPIVTGRLNVQAIYNIVSGKARKQKNLYRYEDLQDNIYWIRERIPDEYFEKMGIPQGKIQEFILFSIGQNPDITKYVKAKNLSKIMLILEEMQPKFPQA